MKKERKAVIRNDLGSCHWVGDETPQMQRDYSKSRVKAEGEGQNLRCGHPKLKVEMSDRQ